MRDLDTLFASRSVPEHLVRGALGLPLLVAAFVHGSVRGHERQPVAR